VVTVDITGDVNDEDDNCSTNPNVSFTDVVNPGICLGDVIITRTWTVTDECGNSSVQQQIITVEDNTDPVVICPPATLDLIGCSVDELLALTTLAFTETITIISPR
jgi:hypothetical protein